MTYFKIDPTKKITEQFLKSQWRKIALELHPDKGGDAEAFKKAQDEYQSLLDRVGSIFTAVEDSPEAYGDWMDFLANVSPVVRQAATEIRPVIERHGAEMEINGTWIWISATNPSMASDLKSVGLKWASKKKQWFFNGQPWRGKRMSKDAIRNTFGSETYRAKKDERLAIG